jgi:hypothetical protein
MQFLNFDTDLSAIDKKIADPIREVCTDNCGWGPIKEKWAYDQYEIDGVFVTNCAIELIVTEEVRQLNIFDALFNVTFGLNFYDQNEAKSVNLVVEDTKAYLPSPVYDEFADEE